MKKVVVFNPYVPTLGGGEKHMGYLCQFIEQYYKEDVQIDILVHDYNEERVNNPNYITVEDINRQFGLDLRRTQLLKVDLKAPQNSVEWAKNKKYIESIFKGYDLMINFTFFSKHIGRAKVNIYECMFPPKRFVQEVHGFVTGTAAKYLDFRFYHSYDKFISNSQFTNHWLSTFWKNSKKNTVIYPPVFSKDEIEGRYVESKKKNIIISVGRFFVASHSKKQLELVRFFVNHLDVFENYEYHLVGAVSTLPKDIEYVNEIKKLAAEAGNVFVHENYPFDKLTELYAQAKIFWHGTGYGVDENVEPDKMEHFGITTVEAMSFGAVPVVINKGGQKETVQEGVNGFRWDDEAECIEKTQRLIKDDKLRQEMAEKSVSMAADYSIETFYEKHEQVFKELGL